MKLYHGSNTVIEKIDLTRSKPNKDFGKGFYLSENKEQAVEMAKQKVIQTEVGIETINTYEFDEKHLTDGTLKVKIFHDYSEEWAEFILMNRDRRNKTKMHDFDIVVGPIADDKVGVQIRLFMDEYIDLPILVKRLQYIKGVTIQYYFGTERAIKTLTRL